MQNKIVVRYVNGETHKGFTADFMPNKDIFHLTPQDTAPGSPQLTINTRDCKAIFFVKDFAGNKEYNDRKDFDPAKTVGGRKLRVVFKDGETLIGTTQGYQPNRPGFFLFPADPNSNMDRTYIIAAATKEVAFI